MYSHSVSRETFAQYSLQKDFSSFLFVFVLSMRRYRDSRVVDFDIAITKGIINIVTLKQKRKLHFRYQVHFSVSINELIAKPLRIEINYERNEPIFTDQQFPTASTTRKECRKVSVLFSARIVQVGARGYARGYHDGLHKLINT